MPRKLLLTGGAGGIGSHAIEHFLLNTDWDITCLDGLSYAGNLNRIADVLRGSSLAGLSPDRLRIVYHNFRSSLDPVETQLGEFDYIVHMGAETHVDRSLTDPDAFVQSNVVGTFNMLAFAKKQRDLRLYVQVSTDEVYGPADEGVYWKEWDRTFPSNPYSATKAGADALAMAWAKCYGIPVVITRTMNNFFERQHPEKYIPMLIRAALLRDRVIKVHGSPGNIGSRHWLHARNHADAILFLLRKAGDIHHNLKHPIDIFNVVGEVEKSNLEILQYVEKFTDREIQYEFEDFHSTRPGHDLRYALDGSKMASLGWKPPVPFEQSLRNTVDWTMLNREWLA